MLTSWLFPLSRPGEIATSVQDEARRSPIELVAEASKIFHRAQTWRFAGISSLVLRLPPSANNNDDDGGGGGGGGDRTVSGVPFASLISIIGQALLFSLVRFEFAVPTRLHRVGDDWNSLHRDTNLKHKPNPPRANDSLPCQRLFACLLACGDSGGALALSGSWQTFPSIAS